MQTLSRYSLWCFEATLIALVVLAPWAFGAGHPIFEVVVACGVALAVCLWGLNLVAQGRMVWVSGESGSFFAMGLCLLLLISVLQTQTLPSSILQLVSPESVRVVNQLMPLEKDPSTVFLPSQGATAIWAAGSKISLNPGGSHQFSIRLLALATLFVAVASLSTDRAMFFRFSMAAASVGTALALFGIIQKLSNQNDQIYGYFQTLGPGFGPFINRNHYPFYANVALGLTVGLMLERIDRSGREWYQWLLEDSWSPWILGAVVFTIASVILCVSRGGAIALIVSGTILCLARARIGRNPHMFAAVLAVVAGTGALLTWIGFDLLASRLMTLAEADEISADGRWSMWSAALRVASMFPVMGSGGETYRYWETILNFETTGNSMLFAYRADNEFLDVLAEYGTGGFIALVLMVAAIFAHGFRQARVDGLAAGAFMGLTAVIVHGCFDFGLRHPATAVFATITAALFFGSGRMSNQPPHESHPRNAGLLSVLKHSLQASRLLPWGIAGACILVSAIIVREKQRYASSEQLQMAAIRAFEIRDFNNCVLYMKRAADKVPEDVETQISTARMILMSAGEAQAEDVRSQNLAMAVAYCLRARSLCPLAWEPHYWLALYADYPDGNHDRLVNLQRAHRLHPADPDVAFALGLVLYEQGYFEQAWAPWKACLMYSNQYLSPITKKSLNHLGVVEYMTLVLPANAIRITEAADLAQHAGRAEDCHVLLQGALTLLQKPQQDGKLRNSAEYFELKARICKRLEQWDQAIITYQQAIEYRPEEVRLRIELAQLLVQQNRLDEAMREIRLALVFAPDMTDLLQLKKRVIRLQSENHLRRQLQ
jgi:tetratricopeptide (TPR) repeat protein/O-antigen ligase